jgi:hypothetical protein
VKVSLPGDCEVGTIRLSWDGQEGHLGDNAAAVITSAVKVIGVHGSGSLRLGLGSIGGNGEKCGEVIHWCVFNREEAVGFGGVRLGLVGYRARLILLYVRAVLMVVGGDPRRREKNRIYASFEKKRQLVRWRRPWRYGIAKRSS